MAWSASSPRLPSAARWNISSVSRRQRATLALKSSFFVPKSRKRYGCEMPARRAMSSVEVPAQPRSANSVWAAAGMAARGSAAERRVGRGQCDVEPSQALGIPDRDALVRGEQLLEPAELRQPERAENVAQPVVEGRTRHVVVARRGRPAVVSQGAGPLGELGVVRRDRTALACRDDLA